MTTNFKKRFSKPAILALCLGLANFASAPAQADGKLTVALMQDPGSLDPVDTFVTFWSPMGTNIFDGLVWRGPDLKLVPGLAASWEELDDGLRLRFHLRQGVKFHNGEPFNAEAVKFTFDRLLGEVGAKGPQQFNYRSIARVEVLDENTVDFHLKEHDPVLLTKLAGYGAMIVPPNYIREQGEDNFNLKPVGTGAFKVVEYRPRIGLTMTANADYWAGAPKISELEFRFINEPATAVAELQAGRIDVATTVPVGMVSTLERSASASIVSAPSPVVVALRFNTRDGITRDVRVRKAMIMAVDREAIISSILQGKAAEISSFQSALSFGNDPDLKPYPYDPEAAKALLKDAGVKEGAPVQIDVRGTDATFIEVAQAVASYLQMVGINASIKPYEVNVLLNDIIPAGKTGEMYQWQWGGWTFDFDNTAIASYHTGEKWNPYDSDAEFDQKLLAQRSISDRAEREKALQAIARHAVEQAYEMNLYNVDAVFGVANRVKNFVPAPDMRFRFNEIAVD